jgi:hypothetical protein
MADPSNIVTPIALDVRPSATLCLPWFVDIHPDGPAEFHPLPASYKPLVNGEEAFGALYDAILAAKRTIDIVCWGFQPSMYFKRDGGKVPDIDQIVPLPPATLPPWDGTFRWQKEQDAAVPPQKPSDELIERLSKDKNLDPATGLSLTASTSKSARADQPADIP